MTHPPDGSLLIAHSSTLIRQGLAVAMGDDEGLANVRQVEDLGGARRELSKRPARVTLCGIELAEDGVAGLVEGLMSCGSESVVVLAPTVREHELLAALEAGALGYLSRDASVDRLVYDLRGAMRGEACLPRDQLAPVLRMLIQRRRDEDERSTRLAKLSKREVEVLQHLATGIRNDEIAARLFLSQATVRTHVQNILGKLGVHSRLEAISLVHQTETPKTRGAAP